jgi:hypothetical protein
MPSHVVLRAGATRRATIGAAALLVAGAAISDSAFAHSGGGQRTEGPSQHSALAPGHAQDPPGRRTHGNQSRHASSRGQHAGAVHASPPATQHAVTRHPSRGRSGENDGSGPATTQSGAPPQNGHHKTTICHATGSATNPYVEISIPPPAVTAHTRHQDGRDIIPAPEGGCPGPATASSPTAQQSDTATAQTPSDAASQAVAGVVASMPLANPSRPTASARHAVLGVEASSNGRSAAPSRLRSASPAASRDGGGGLPFTGFAPALAAALGIALAAAGFGVRRATRA